MSKKRKYRIVTNGEFFRIQKQKKFLGIKWWKFIKNGMPFIKFSNAQQSMKNNEKREEFLKEIRSEQKAARKRARKSSLKKAWKPVEKEN